MSRKGKFCPHCGQKEFKNKLEMKDLLSRFLVKAFHVNNKFLVMSRHAVRPAHVSLDFFQGRIKRYPHPLQFFFLSMFVLLLLYSKVKPDTSVFNVNIGEQQDSVHFQIKDPKALLQRTSYAVELWNAFEALPDSMHTKRDSVLLDTLISTTNAKGREFMEMLSDPDSIGVGKNRWYFLDTIPLNLVLTSKRIALVDLMNMSPDSLADYYKITNWRDRILVKQGVRTVLQPDALVKAYMGSFVWTLLSLMAALSGIMWLLYRKQKHYYTEHFVFLLHLHTGLILMLSLFLLLLWIVPSAMILIAPLLIWMAVFIVWSMRRFYHQGLGITLLKFLLLSFLYIVLFVVFYIATLVLVFFLF
ncbi:MAG: DUF3667 domain-containing protein [Saprospiraceae bacterium]